MTDPRKKRQIVSLRTFFLTGLVVAAPIGITLYLIWSFVAFVDKTVIPLIPARYNPETYLPYSIPGLGVVLLILALILLGMLTANFLGRSLLTFGERVVERMPVVRSIYATLKQIMETVVAQGQQSFQQVCLVEYPRRGIWAIGFISTDTKGIVRAALDQEMVNVFLPTTPNPTSGFLLFVPRADIIILEMTVEEAAKSVISAGLVMPDKRSPDAAEAPDQADRQAKQKRGFLGLNGRRKTSAEAPAAANQEAATAPEITAPPPKDVEAFTIPDPARSSQT
ncbi:MAG: DUF502 domain-containing protein [Pseudomonadota bacterium]